ncbi:hypothetical protein OAA86_08195 [Rhodospirillales bacterium]|nr:hypothetical protein [Rhodospirillales bacterium]
MITQLNNNPPYPSHESKVGRLAWKRVEEFLKRPDFNGFTKDDLFIMNFIKKAWGQDIAALSNMAEAISLRHRHQHLDLVSAKSLMMAAIERALHKSVSPYRKNISAINDLGRHGYYLEHLNIILGNAASIGVSQYENLNLRISEHLSEQSLAQTNAHAPLMPHVKMRWSADQAAILYSLWMCDKNYKTNFYKEPSDKWVEYMKKRMTHAETGLFETEAMRVKRYSRQPRGCALAYLIHYTSKFAPEVARGQWELFKENMYRETLGLCGFREYLPSYGGKWTPDSGPIIGGIGVAATGLGLKAASSMSDEDVMATLRGSLDSVIRLCQGVSFIPGINVIASIGTDILASSILSACSFAEADIGNVNAQHA